jgi:hypothetical protein
MGQAALGQAALGRLLPRGLDAINATWRPNAPVVAGRPRRPPLPRPARLGAAPGNVPNTALAATAVHHAAVSAFVVAPCAASGGRHALLEVTTCTGRGRLALPPPVAIPAAFRPHRGPAARAAHRPAGRIVWGVAQALPSAVHAAVAAATVLAHLHRIENSSAAATAAAAAIVPDVVRIATTVVIFPPVHRDGFALRWGPAGYKAAPAVGVGARTCGG